MEHKLKKHKQQIKTILNKGKFQESPCQFFNQNFNRQFTTKRSAGFQKNKYIYEAH